MSLPSYLICILELIRRGTPIEMMGPNCFIDYVLHEKQGRYLSPYFSFVWDDFSSYKWSNNIRNFR